MNAPELDSSVGRQRSGPNFLCRGFILVTLVFVLITLFYAFENWRGTRAWNRYVQAAQARGESLELPPATRRPIPRGAGSVKPYEQEFASADQICQQAESLVPPVPSNSPDRQFENLVAWAQAIACIKSGETNLGLKEAGISNTNAAARAEAAGAVLEALSGHDALVRKLQSACRRPELEYPFGYSPEDAFPAVPQVFDAINLCRRLRLKVSAELVAGRNADAFRELDLMFCLSDSLGREPFLIGAVGAMACRSIALRCPWEGLAERRFTETELRRIQSLIGSFDVRQNLLPALWGERAQVIRWFDRALKTPDFRKVFEGSSKSFETALRLIPAGWIQLDKVDYCQSIDAIIAAGFGESQKRILPAALDRAHEQVHSRLSAGTGVSGFLKHTVISSICMPKVADLAATSTAAQVTADQTRLACGLELYYLKKGAYPEKLEQIVPEFVEKMPADPISGGPYRYVREQSGRYKLWSVGWNEKDDGGIPGQQLFDHKTGDWVWSYPGT